MVIQKYPVVFTINNKKIKTTYSFPKSFYHPWFGNVFCIIIPVNWLRFGCNCIQATKYNNKQNWQLLVISELFLACWLAENYGLQKLSVFATLGPLRTLMKNRVWLCKTSANLIFTNFSFLANFYASRTCNFFIIII